MASALNPEGRFTCTYCQVRFDSPDVSPMCPQGCRQPVETPDPAGGFSTATPFPEPPPKSEKAARKEFRGVQKAKGGEEEKY